MCLTKVDRKRKVLKGVGYQVCEIEKDSLGREIYKSFYRGDTRVIGKKYVDKNNEKGMLLDGMYPYGYHLFLSYKDALMFAMGKIDAFGDPLAIIQCSFTKVGCTGTQYYHPIMISLNMKCAVVPEMRVKKLMVKMEKEVEGENLDSTFYLSHT
jgi:hypothetical protein